MRTDETSQSSGGEADEPDDLLGGIDFLKIWDTVRRNWVWLLLLPLVGLVSAYLFLRYTTPIYESSSSLKLEMTQQANELGLPGLNNAQPSTNISGEIELIQSNLIYDEVIAQTDLDVSYYAYGRSRIKNEERYQNPPFRVKYEVKNPVAYNQPFDVEIIGKDRFKLSYTLDDTDYSGTHAFGQAVETPFFRFVLIAARNADQDNSSHYFTLNSPDALRQYLASNLRVEVVNPAANIIGVFFKDASIRKAQEIVNKIDTVYLEKTKELKNKANKQKIAFLNQQIGTVEDELDAYESDLERFVVSNKTSDVGRDLEKYTAKIDELASTRAELNAQAYILSNLYQSLAGQKELTTLVSSLPLLSDTEIAALVTEINKMHQERMMLAKSYRETTYALQSKDQQIATTRESLVSLISQKRRIVNEKSSLVNAELAKAEAVFAGLPAQGTEYNRIKRMRDLKEKYHSLMVDKKAELGIAAAGTREDFVILSPASSPSLPISPNKMLVYGSCLVISLLLGVLLIGTKYVLHDTISSQRELESGTTAPLLGVIPMYQKEKLDTSRLVVYQNPKSTMSEAFRSVRTNMDFMFQMQQKKRIIAVTSTISGEGKTFVALNLSGVIALSSHKVVLLDLDMRRPKVHQAFEEDNYNGISTLLIGKHTLAECLRKTPIENMDFIAAGPMPPNPSELILRPEFDNLLKELHQTYDVIVIDTPPIGLVTDGILVMRKADLPVYVLRADYSKRVFLKNINKLIKSNNFSKLAVVLNAFRNVNRYGYGGYNYGYGYNDYYEDEPEPGKRLDKLRGLLVKNK